jgi:V-type H+-transporting ATPase subunit d
MLKFNIDDGFLDSLVRGYRSGFLSAEDYSNLAQSQTVEDIRMHLQTTEYGNFLESENANAVRISALHTAATDKMVKEFNYLRCHAVYPLSQFLDYVTHGFMIDNVALILTGTLRNPTKEYMDELMSKCHPLGYFPTLAAVSLAGTSEGKLLPGSSQGIDNMFKEIMLETPLAVYFSSNFVTGDLREKDIEEIKAKLYRSYLHSFHSFCMELGGVTAELMGPILQFEADRRAINITFNSLQTELNKDDRAGMFPSIGFLLPEGHLKLKNAEDDEAVKRAISHIQIYKTIMEKHESNAQKNLEDFFWEQEVEMCKRVFDQQFHYGVFYAFVKLREQVRAASRPLHRCARCLTLVLQEVRNIVWIAECITQGQKDRINDYVPIF